MTNIRFRQAAAGDAGRCIQLTLNAFRDDPLFRAVSGGDGKSYRLFLGLLLKLWLKNQTAFLAEEDGSLAGFAILAPEEASAIRVGECLKAGAGRVLLSCGVKNIFDFLRASGAFGEELQKQPPPRWYLTLLAVSPSRQGKGVGSALLQECVLPFLRTVPCKTLCLNTNAEQNRSFYRKNGFTELNASSRRINGRTVENWSYARAKAGEGFAFSDRFDTLSRGNMTLKLREKKERGRVQLPYYYYDILVDGVPAGKISIRIGDNFHTYYNGHIGYEVDPEFQGHGYARQACELVLDVARFHAMPSVLLTCAEDNIPSYRTIEKLGGRLLEICEVPREYFAWYEGIPRHRIYQLDL